MRAVGRGLSRFSQIARVKRDVGSRGVTESWDWRLVNSYLGASLPPYSNNHIHVCRSQYNFGFKGDQGKDNT